ncbi:MAG: acyl-CoA dehydrogenase [Desulfobacterales bacterium CG23_combo_of_CG06-09_8_20_14_all_52_9]|nr:MAG: acyl-CoA dehydrogenase [Desulfobacterales bacterium CG23_combo_of_CG06-09_8_20_14_all_52_9]
MIRSNPESLIRESMARFVEKEVIPKAQQVDASEEFPAELFQKVAKMGVFGIRYPRDKGGSGGNTTLYCIICEELAKGLMSLAAITAMQCLMGTNFLFHYGTEEMREKYFLPAMRGEKIPCFCLTEPEAGSDLGAVTTLAQRTKDGFVVNGMKTWVTNGPIADFYTVLCQTDPIKRLRGLNFFFIPRETPGVSVSAPFELLGTRTTRMSEVAFTNVHIPPEFMLGQEEEGLSNLMSILSEIRAMTAALAVGLLRASMNDSIRYAKERVAFGHPIAQYQLIQAKIANMATELEAARLLTYQATRMIDNQIPCLKEATMAKYFATEAACKAADEATRIFGAYGYSMEYPVQRYYRDSRFLLNGGGTHEVLQTNIARWSGL